MVRLMGPPSAVVGDPWPYGDGGARRLELFGLDEEMDRFEFFRWREWKSFFRRV